MILVHIGIDFLMATVLARVLFETFAINLALCNYLLGVVVVLVKMIGASN